MTWKDIKFFKPSEFDSPDYPGSGELNMSLELVSLLDLIRSKINKPLTVTSGFRTYAHNKKVGGQPNSSHLRGYAADIFCGSDNQLRFALVEEAIKVGIHRFEIAPVHVHLDIDKSLTPSTMVFLTAYPKL